MRISAIVLTKNEESMIADCLDSLSFCDEIVLVDSGSEDRTLEIAKRMGAKVFNFEDESFAKKRDFGRKIASGDWVLYVDADERVDEELRRNIISVARGPVGLYPRPMSSVDKLPAGTRRGAPSSATPYSAFRLKRKNFYLGENEWPHIENLERLFRKDKLKGWIGELHESPVVDGEISDLDGFLLHFTHRDLSSMVEKTNKWSDIEARLRLDSNHPKMSWWRFPRVMIWTFLDYYIKQGGWKIGTAGLVESIYQSFSIFITYAKLWELQNKTKS